MLFLMSLTVIGLVGVDMVVVGKRERSQSTLSVRARGVSGEAVFGFGATRAASGWWRGTACLLRAAVSELSLHGICWALIVHAQCSIVTIQLRR